jgi:hypothetical protein
VSRSLNGVYRVGHTEGSGDGDLKYLINMTGVSCRIRRRRCKYEFWMGARTHKDLERFVSPEL